MSNWMIAQYSGNLLPPALMNQFHSVGDIAPYGMGWLVDQDESGGRTISHSGIFWTYKSEETVYLDEQMGIAVMFNSGLNAFVNYSAFTDGIADIMRGEQPEISFFNDRNMETIMIVLILATLVWGAYGYVRIRRRTRAALVRPLDYPVVTHHLACYMVTCQSCALGCLYNIYVQPHKEWPIEG